MYSCMAWLVMLPFDLDKHLCFWHVFSSLYLSAQSLPKVMTTGFQRVRGNRRRVLHRKRLLDRKRPANLVLRPGVMLDSMCGILMSLDALLGADVC